MHDTTLISTKVIGCGPRPDGAVNVATRVHHWACQHSDLCELRAGLVVMPDSFMEVHRAPIISLAARNNVPVVYYDHRFVRDGGLISYGPNIQDFYRRAAPPM
jgi:hypothetical protein